MVDARSLARASLPVAVSLLLLWYTLGDVNLSSVLQRLAIVRPAYVGLLLFLEAATIVLIAQRWRLILRATGCDITLREAVTIYLAGSPAEVLMPLKTSDLLKANYLRVTLGFPFAKGVSSVFLDNVFDLAALVAIAVAGFALTGESVDGRAAVGLVGAGFFVAAAVAVSRAVDHPVFASFRSLGARTAGIILANSLLLWLGVCVIVTVVFAMAGAPVPFPVAMLYLPLTIMVVAIPVTVAGLGSNEWCLRTFYGRFGSPEAIIAADVIQRVVSTGIPVVLGLPFVGSFLWPQGPGEAPSAAPAAAADTMDGAEGGDRGAAPGEATAGGESAGLGAGACRVPEPEARGTVSGGAPGRATAAGHGPSGGTSAGRRKGDAGPGATADTRGRQGAPG